LTAADDSEEEKVQPKQSAAAGMVEFKIIFYL